MKLTRRQALKASAIGAGAVVAAAVLPAVPAVADPIREGKDFMFYGQSEFNGITYSALRLRYVGDICVETQLIK